MTTAPDGRPPALLLGPDHAAWIGKGISAIVASRDAQRQPSLMRAVGADVGAQGERVTVYLNRLAARQVLADLEATGQIAVVFSEPSSHRTLQVKASRVDMRPAEAADAPLLQRYLRGMEWQLHQVGITPHQVRTMLSHRLSDVVAVSFAPEQAFDQTPGRSAGARIGVAPPASGALP